MCFFKRLYSLKLIVGYIIIELDPYRQSSADLLRPNPIKYSVFLFPGKCDSFNVLYFLSSRIFYSLFFYFKVKGKMLSYASNRGKEHTTMLLFDSGQCIPCS